MVGLLSPLQDDLTSGHAPGVGSGRGAIRTFPARSCSTRWTRSTRPQPQGPVTENQLERAAFIFSLLALVYRESTYASAGARGHPATAADQPNKRTLCGACDRSETQQGLVVFCGTQGSVDDLHACLNIPRIYLRLCRRSSSGPRSRYKNQSNSHTLEATCHRSKALGSGAQRRWGPTLAARHHEDSVSVPWSWPCWTRKYTRGARAAGSACHPHHPPLIVLLHDTHTAACYPRRRMMPPPPHDQRVQGAGSSLPILAGRSRLQRAHEAESGEALRIRPARARG